MHGQQHQQAGVCRERESEKCKQSVATSISGCAFCQPRHATSTRVHPPSQPITRGPERSRGRQLGPMPTLWPELPNHSWPQVLARPLLSIFF